MQKLANRKCMACSKDHSLIKPSEYPKFLEELDHWSIKKGKINKLAKVFIFHDYSSTTSFANGIIKIAEQEDHHPKIILEWGKVGVYWWTHKIKGLHINDFICAARVDRLFKLFS